MYERFTDRARKVMQLAGQEATALNQPYVGAEHILAGLLQQEGVAKRVLMHMGLSLNKVREVRMVAPSDVNALKGRVPFSDAAKRVVEKAVIAARDLNDNYIATEHVLIGLLQDRDGEVVSILSRFDVSADEVVAQVIQLLQCPPGESEI